LRHTTGATSRPPIIRPSKTPQKIVGKEPAPQAAVATTRKEPAVVATTSRHQKLLGTSIPQPSKAKAVAPQLGGNDDDDDNVDVDAFLNTGASRDLYMPPVHADGEPFRAHRDQPARLTACTQRLTFQGLSQDMPLEAGDQAQLANVFSPGTLRKSVHEGVQSPEMKKKKHMKRIRPGASVSQPAPKTIRGHEDMVSPHADGLTRVHEAGKPKLPPELLRLAQGPMHSLHGIILTLEGILLKDKNPNYPVFTAQVPKDFDFIHEALADLFFIAYEDVFKLFHS